MNGAILAELKQNQRQISAIGQQGQEPQTTADNPKQKN
jgi:hypothetical protein